MLSRKQRILKGVTTLALRPLLGDGANSVTRSIFDRLTDASQKIIAVFQISQERAWQAIEISLAGQSWWDRCKQSVSNAENKAFREQVQLFLASMPLSDEILEKEAFRQECLKDLKSAKKQGLLPGESLHQQELQEQGDFFNRFQDPSQLAKTQLEAVSDLSTVLAEQGFPNLGRFVGMQPKDGTSLIVVAVQFFFRQQIESDPELARGLIYQQVEQLSQIQQLGFAALNQTLDRHGQLLDSLLDQLALLAERVEETAIETQRVVRDETELLRQQIEMMERKQAELFQTLFAMMGQNGVQTNATVEAPTPSQVHELIQAGDSDRSEAKKLAAELAVTTEKLEVARQRLPFNFLPKPRAKTSDAPAATPNTISQSEAATESVSEPDKGLKKIKGPLISGIFKKK
jgi:hypothetical protein